MPEAGRLLSALGDLDLEEKEIRILMRGMTVGNFLQRGLHICGSKRLPVQQFICMCA